MTRNSVLKSILTMSVLVTTLSFATAANAREESGVTITGIVVDQDGSFYIETNRTLCDTGSGTNRGYARRGVDAGDMTWTSDGADMMLSIAQMAMVSNRTVRVFTDDAEDFWSDGSNRWGCLMYRIALQ